MIYELINDSSESICLVQIEKVKKENSRVSLSMTRSKHDIVILEDSWMSDRSCQLLQKGLGCRHFFNIVQSSLRQEMEIFFDYCDY